MFITLDERSAPNYLFISSFPFDVGIIAIYSIRYLINLIVQLNEMKMKRVMMILDKSLSLYIEHFIGRCHV